MHTKVQKQKMIDLLKEREWVCVEDFTKLFIVDYRRRLVDIQRMGYVLESRRCIQHSYHKGGSKEWKITGTPTRTVYDYELRAGVRVPVAKQIEYGE